MINARFEDDMAEVSGDGYLMLCQGRQRVFMKGVTGSPVELASVTAFRETKGAILLQGDAGQISSCPFPSTLARELQPIVERLNKCLAKWREEPSGS